MNEVSKDWKKIYIVGAMVQWCNICHSGRGSKQDEDRDQGEDDQEEGKEDGNR